jgi:hypothetical protein
VAQDQDLGVLGAIGAGEQGKRTCPALAREKDQVNSSDRISGTDTDSSITACILLSWLRLLALDGKLAKAGPKTLRYRVLHAAARLVRGGRRRILKIAALPWASAIITAWHRIQALPHST